MNAELSTPKAATSVPSDELVRLREENLRLVEQLARAEASLELQSRALEILGGLEVR
jgi:hypothetical protein